MYRETTSMLTVTVEPEFLEGQSRPDEGHFVWAYHITIRNEGDRSVQLMNRHWRIVDAAGRLQEVRGPGVVGEQPVLPPGGSFQYTSGTPLSTPSGFMVGTYQMVDEEGSAFDIRIPAFSLDSPHLAHSVH